MSIFSFSLDCKWVDPAAVETLLGGEIPNMVIVAHYVDTEFSLAAEVTAASAAEAAETFRTVVSSAGIVARRFDLGLMSVTEIALELGVARETVRLWTTGARREGFPPRYASLGPSRVWAWSEVHQWARTRNTNRPDEPCTIPLHILEKANGELAEVFNSLSAPSR